VCDPSRYAQQVDLVLSPEFMDSIDDDRRVVRQAGYDKAIIMQVDHQSMTSLGAGRPTVKWLTLDNENAVVACNFPKRFLKARVAHRQPQAFHVRHRLSDWSTPTWMS
jgi:hypothetical protein